jgi:CubicO group peptidase (beta-lactamase class C family)
MNSQESQTIYQPEIFLDKNRLQKIKRFLPKLKALYRKYAKTHSIPGFAYAVLVDGIPLAIECEGYGDILEKKPISPQSIFRLASITKSFTAMAILKLRDEGYLRLDDFVSLYLPEIKGQKLTVDSPEITVGDLLSHVAGFPEDNAWGDRQLEMTDHDLGTLLTKGVHFSTVPQTTYEYSNLGYVLLGCLVTKLSGMSCQEYITKNILEPLEMHSACWDYRKVPPQNLVRGYAWREEEWHEEKLAGDGVFAPMGGLWASLEDLCKYVGFHQQAWPCRDEVDNCFIKRSTVRSMHQPRVIGGPLTVMEGVAGYGYGLRWDQDLNRIKYISHSGGLPGFGCNWVMMPDYGIAVIFLANVTYAPAFKANIEALHKVLRQIKIAPRMIQPSSVLKTRQTQLLQVLPAWADSLVDHCFASNFFLDQDVETWKIQSQDFFSKIGKVIRIGDVIPENRLRGEFIIEGSKSSLKVKFTLAPDEHALIQSIYITPLASIKT